MSIDAERERIRHLFATFFAPEDAVRHPLYASLCARTATDDTLIDLLLDVPEAQARPNLIFAALHDLALEDPEGELALHYPTASHFLACGQSADTPARLPLPSPPPFSDAASQLIAWVDQHQGLVASRIAGRSTQTNEIGRNAVLSAGVAQAAQGRDVALVDLGCSAGLNLLVDRYRIERSDGVSLGDPSSPIVIHTETSGRPMPTQSPSLVRRTGIDLNPPDLDDDAAVRWLLACQWPDDLERFERSRLAMGMWRSTRPRPTVVTGDAISTLPAVIAQIPEDLLVVVQHSWVATYMPIEVQRELGVLLRDLIEQRPLAWLSFEHPRMVPGLCHPHTTAPRISGSTTLVVEDRDGARVLAQAHPHGSWVNWEV